jgi:hypothetical protein
MIDTKRGRPKSNKTPKVHISIRIDRQTRINIDQSAKNNGRSRSSELEFFIEKKYGNKNLKPQKL